VIDANMDVGAVIDYKVSDITLKVNGDVLALVASLLVSDFCIDDLGNELVEKGVYKKQDQAHAAFMHIAATLVKAGVLLPFGPGDDFPQGINPRSPLLRS
jgi:hypothetical protein